MDRDRAARVWTQVARRARGAPISLAHVCAAAVTEVGVDGAGIAVMSGHTVRETVYATDGVAADLEQLQLTLGEGPCLDTFVGGGPALALDLRSPEFRRRWPVFGPAALASGARAVFALPMQIGAIGLGAFDLYRTRPGPLTREQLADALAYAETAGMLLLDGGAAGPDADGSTPRHDDPTARQAVVHQATGMILARLDSTAEVAFVRLRAYAFAQDRPLAEVARDVVDRRLRFHPDKPPTGQDTA